MSDNRFETLILDWLRPIVIRCRQIVLRTATPCSPSVSMIRGVWGRALHHLDNNAYQTVFQGTGPGHLRQPSYMIRSSENGFSENGTVFHLDWVTWGNAVIHDRTLVRAWDVAAGMGLDRQRIPFVVDMSHPAEDLSMADVAWPIPGSPAITPCRVQFQVPLRIVRDKHTITTPSLADLTEAAISRLALVRSLICDDIPMIHVPQSIWPDFAEAAIALATTVSTTRWHGRGQTLVRYSAKQQAEVTMNGVTGFINCLDGTGPLWPILAAATWLHLGKGTVIGLGRPEIIPLKTI